MRKLIAMTCGLAALALWAGSARAQIPHKINFQGRLADAAGSPRTGLFNMQFQIYSAATGGSMCHDETVAGVPVNSGLFSVVIGGGATPLNCIFGSPQWLAIRIDPDSSFMNPRVPLVSMAYAFVAERLAIGSSSAQLGNNGSQVPISNGSFTSYLSADMLGGRHYSGGTSLLAIPVYTCAGYSGLYVYRASIGGACPSGAAATEVGRLAN